MDWMYICLGLLAFYIIYEWIIRKPRVGDIHKKYILITGCDTGFGHLASLRFDKLGAHVISGCLTENGARDLQSKASSRLLAIKMDVTKDEDVKNAAEQVKKHLPEGTGLWTVINNAGVLGPVGPLEWMTPDKMHKVFNVNMYGMLRVTNAFLPFLKKCPGSRVINTSSVVGRFAVPYTSAYSLSKYLVQAYSDSIRRELRIFGISVHIIEPGAHKTTFLEEELVVKNAHQCWNSLSEDMQKEYGYKYFEKMLFIATKVIVALATATPDGVVSAYEHAAVARYPKTRYSIGADSPFYIAAHYLPTRLVDWVLSFKVIEPRPQFCFK